MKKKRFVVGLLALIILAGCVFVLVGCDAKLDRLNFYDIEAKFCEENMSLECDQSVTYFNNSENVLDEVCFFLYANAYDEGQKTISTAYFDKAYPNGASYGNIEFEKIESSGQKKKFAISEDKTILTVDLEQDLFPDESIVIDMSYVVYLANINHRLGYGENTVNFGNFFPIACVYEKGFVKNKFTPNGDPFYSEASNFKVKIFCPEEYVVASTGNKVESIAEGLKIVECSAERVRDFCFVASKNFDVKICQIEDVEVKYFFYDDENAQEHLRTSVKAIETFSELFSKYPYKQLSVVQTNFCFGGMEYPNLVMISDQIKDDATYNYVIVHEIAHQWWYGMVGNNQYEDAWLDEGLTEFSTALFFENNTEYGFDYEEIMTNATQVYQNFVKVFEKINGQVDETMSRNLSEFTTEPEYVNIAYTKGMLLFDSLRTSMSDSKFFRCLKTYFKEYQYMNSSPDKLISSFSKTSHRNLNKFFEAWIDGSVIVGIS